MKMSEPAFDQLRTKEQLGYIVFTSIKRLNQQHLALHIMVQSSHKDADYLDGRIESFLCQYRAMLLAMPQKEFQENVAAVIEKLVEKPKNIDEVSGGGKEEEGDRWIGCH
jgi:insulysin